MLNGELMPNNNNNNNDFAIFKTSISEISEALNANVGGGGLSAADLSKIRLPAGGGINWTTTGIDGEETTKDLLGIITNWRDTRAYWSLPMAEADANTPPDCASNDALLGVGRPGGNCLKCHLAEFGSDARGERQACKLVRQLFLLRPGNLLPEVVHLPPSSIKVAKQYLLLLAARGIPCYGVITRIGLEKAKNAQGIVYSRAVLTSAGRLTPEQAQQAKAYATMIEPLWRGEPRPANNETEGEVV